LIAEKSRICDFQFGFKANFIGLAVVKARKGKLKETKSNIILCKIEADQERQRAIS